MTRDILLFGSVCPICLDAIDENGYVVRGLDEKYEDTTNVRMRFDVLPSSEKGVVMFVFLMDGDWENENTNQDFISSVQAYLITGDHGNDCIPYPFVGELNYQKRLLTMDYFVRMWKKNSDALGGDPFEFEWIKYTANGIYVVVKFEV